MATKAKDKAGRAVAGKVRAGETSIGRSGAKTAPYIKFKDVSSNVATVTYSKTYPNEF